MTGFTGQQLLSNGMTHPLNWGHCASVENWYRARHFVELPSQFEEIQKRPAFWRKNGRPQARESGNNEHK